MNYPVAILRDTRYAVLLSSASIPIVPMSRVAPVGPKGDPGGNIMAIGLFEDAHLLSIPVGTDAVRTSGHTVPGLGIADYFADVAVDSAYVTAHPRTSFISTNARGFRLAKGIHYNVFQFGAVANGSSNDGPAIQAGIDHISAQGGGMLSQPAGFYATSQKIHVRATVNWIGDGVGFDARLVAPNVYPGSVILFAAGLADDGVEFYPLMDSEDLPVVPTQQGSQGSHLQGMRFWHLGGASGPGHSGVKIRTVMSVSDCEVLGFGGVGFDVSASTGGGAPYGNASCGTYSHIFSHENGSHGFRFAGADANVLQLIGLNSTSNNGWAYYDDSSYSNFYAGCHASSNGLGSFRSNSDSHNVLHTYFACYVEGTGDVSSHSEIGPFCTIIGGNLMGVRHTYQPLILAPAQSDTVSRGGLRFYDNIGAVPVLYSFAAGQNLMVAREWGSEDADGPRMKTERRVSLVEQYDQMNRRWTVGGQTDGPKLYTMPGVRAAPSKAYLDANSEGTRLAAVEANRKFAMSVGSGVIFGDGRYTRGFGSGIFESSSTGDVDPGYWRAGDVIKKPVTNAGYLAWCCATSGWYGALPAAWAAGTPIAPGLALGTKVTNGGNIYYASSWDEVMHPSGVTTTGNAPTHTTHIEVVGTDGIGWTFLCASSPLATFQNTWPVT